MIQVLKTGTYLGFRIQTSSSRQRERGDIRPVRLCERSGRRAEHAQKENLSNETYTRPTKTRTSCSRLATKAVGPF